jgi:hypothetical protein
VSNRAPDSPRRRPFPRSLVCVALLHVALPLLACEEPAAPRDAGAGSGLDAGERPDAGEAPDAGDEADAGDPPDAGAPPDGGGQADAGARPDGGGAPLDGGLDASIPMDAGFGEAELRALLAAFQPGALHEALPHGVPNSYDWYDRSRADPMRGDLRLTSLNWWAQVFADSSGTRPPNTRVAVKGGVVLLLFENETTWQVGQRSDVLEGGSWSEDFQSYPCGTFNMRTEPDMSRSFVPDPGCASHFWPNVAHVDIGTRQLRAVVAVAHARLVLGDPVGVDDRAQARYLVGLGVDWRDPVGGCPTNDAGVAICSGAGVGRMARPTTQWRAVVFSTMTSSDLASLPLPPIDHFRPLSN